MERFGYVYETTNLVNGKTYIGQHKCPYFDDRYFGSGRLIGLAYHRYGRESFKCRVLRWCDNLDEMNYYEKFFIAEARKFGKAEYNIADGGPGSPGLFGEKNPFYGRKHNTETRKKLSDKAKLRKGPLCPAYGRKMTPEHIAKTRRTGSVQSEKTRAQISASLTRDHECRFCKEIFHGHKKLKAHLIEVHNWYGAEALRQNVRKLNSIVYDCPYCERQIKSKGNLTQHIRANHDKNYNR